jgi:hypothetical protein
LNVEKKNIPSPKNLGLGTWRKKPEELFKIPETFKNNQVLIN